LRRRKREEGFGVGGKVIAAIGTIETFGKDNDLGTCGCCRQDLLAGVGEIVRFVCAYSQHCQLTSMTRGKRQLIPLANCTRASLTGFFSRPDMFLM